VVYPDGKFGKEKFFYTGPLRLVYSEVARQMGVVQWHWESGEIKAISHQEGLRINAGEDQSWEISRINQDGSFYPGRVGFRLFPTTNSPGLDVYVASPFKGVFIINEHGNEIADNRIISINTLYANKYIIMGYNTVNFRIFHQQNPRVAIK